jgi:hypothetical protein
MADHGFLAGSSLTTKFPIAAGWCSPAPPTKVYERSKPSGPSTFIAQLSFARDPMIDTCHSPGLSLSTCSMRAAISPRVRGSPVFCISILTAITPTLYKAARLPPHVQKPVRIVGWVHLCAIDLLAHCRARDKWQNDDFFLDGALVATMFHRHAGVLLRCG